MESIGITTNAAELNQLDGFTMYTGEFPPPEASIGTMYLDNSSGEMMIMTEDGYVNVGGIEDLSQPIGQPWYSPPGYDRSHIYGRIIDIRVNIYKDMDELYIVNEVQKAKKLGYLFLEDVDEVDRHPIRIKYFEWCFRHNLPYMVAYKYRSKYRIILHLNPRNVYIGKIFNPEAHAYIIDLFYRREYWDARITYNGSDYDICYLSSYEEVIDILNEVTRLYRDSNNLDMDY